MELLIATNNAHKVEEFKRLFAGLEIGVFSLKEKGISVEIEENGSTFAENAYIKAKTIYDLTKVPVIADDSGICVDALSGAPGVYSARYGGEGLDDKGRTALLLKNMEGVEDRSAHFACAICYIDALGKRHDFYGECQGTIGFSPKGENGFGYDPVFMVGEKSFSELSGKEKDQISHRGKANQKLLAYMKGETGNDQ